MSKIRIVRPGYRSLLLVILLSGCSKPPVPDQDVAPVSPGEPVVARVGDREILASDLEKDVQRRVDARLPIPGKEVLLREMVAYEAMAQRARNAGVADDLGVKRQIDNILIGELKKRELKAKLAAVEITEDEIRAEYEKRIAQYTRPAQVRLAALVLKAGKVVSSEKQKELTDRLSEAREKAIASPAPGGRGPAAGGFAALALEYSEDQASRYRGGDIGWMEKLPTMSRWPMTVLKAGYALEKGQISDVLEAEGGYYLVMKSDDRPEVVTPFEKVSAALRQSLLVQKRRAMNDAFLEESLQLVGAEIDFDCLAQVPLSVPGTGEVPGREPVLPVLPGM